MIEFDILNVPILCLQNLKIESGDLSGSLFFAPGLVMQYLYYLNVSLWLPAVYSSQCIKKQILTNYIDTFISKNRFGSIKPSPVLENDVMFTKQDF